MEEHLEYLLLDEFDDKPKEECGVLGVILDNDSASYKLYTGMQGIQHRGELGAGMSVSDGKNLRVYKNVGLVTDIFQPRTLKTLKGYCGIGHTRYATTATGKEKSKKDAIKKLHPFIGRETPFNTDLFSVVFNGTITNYNTVRKQLGRYKFETETDTEAITHLLEEGYKLSGDMVEALSYTYMKLEGAFSIVVNDKYGNIYAMRDGHGFKPLCLGEIKNEYDKGYIIASESRAVDFLDGKVIRTIKPGEIIQINNQMEINSLYMNKKRPAFCFFEYVYFASIDSVIPDSETDENIGVNNVRVRLGKNLWNEDNLELTQEEKDEYWRVVPVPDSGRSAAFGYASEGGFKIREGLMRNRYFPKRTFINGNPEERKNAALMKSQKYNVIEDVVKDKNIILVDDSIVRGNTMANIIGRLRNAGAKSVHLKISCPPILHPCYMGIDFPTHEELIAYKKNIDEITKILGADSLQYMSVEGLIKSIKRVDSCSEADCGLCLACLNGDYPCKLERELLKTKKKAEATKE